MKYPKCRILLLALLILPVLSVNTVGALPSGGRYPPTFVSSNGVYYDSWGFKRTSAGGANGFLPNVAYETIGTDRELAYSLGESFRTQYPNTLRRAKEILNYVQKMTKYGYDKDNVVIDGKAKIEWAWNADEMAHRFDEDTNVVAVGDCEDMSFLCATLYLAAGFDVVLVNPPGHVALLIWLPEYPNANYYWDIADDGRGAGWIWVEATGDSNPLGWTPPDFNDGDLIAFPISLMISQVSYSPKIVQEEETIEVTASVFSARTSISQVSLHYSIEGLPYQEMPMPLKGSVYETVLPKQPKGTALTFYISATDQENNTKQSDIISLNAEKDFEIADYALELIIISVAIVAAILIVLKKRKKNTRA